MSRYNPRIGGRQAVSRCHVLCVLAALVAGSPAAAQVAGPDIYCSVIAASTDQAHIRSLNQTAAALAQLTGADAEAAQNRASIAEINRSMAQGPRDALEARLNEARYKPVDTSQMEAALAFAREERNARAHGVRVLLEQRRALEALELQRRGGGGVSEADLQAARDSIAAQERQLASGKPLNQLDAEVAEAEAAIRAALVARQAQIVLLQSEFAAADRVLAERQQEVNAAQQHLTAAYAVDSAARAGMWQVAACAQARIDQLTAAATPSVPPPAIPLAAGPLPPRPPTYVPAAPPPVYVPAVPPPVVVAAPPVVVVPAPPRYVPPPDYRRPAHVVAPNRGPGYGPPQRHAGPSSHPPPRRQPSGPSHSGAHVKPQSSGSMTHVKPAPTGGSMNKPMSPTAPGTPQRQR